jgi:hypothetical protein
MPDAKKAGRLVLDLKHTPQTCKGAMFSFQKSSTGSLDRWLMFQWDWDSKS